MGLRANVITSSGIGRVAANQGRGGPAAPPVSRMVGYAPVPSE
jgi:hypothetical protein